MGTKPAESDKLTIFSMVSPETLNSAAGTSCSVKGLDEVLILSLMLFILLQKKARNICKDEELGTGFFRSSLATVGGWEVRWLQYIIDDFLINGKQM